jgi:hypothetical protein
MHAQLHICKTYNKNNNVKSQLFSNKKEIQIIINIKKIKYNRVQISSLWISRFERISICFRDPIVE